MWWFLEKLFGRPKWEMKSVTCAIPSNAVGVINHEVEKGWELCGIVYGPPGYTVFLKRRVP